MKRETIPHVEVPAHVANEARELLSRCRLYTTYGGTGWLITDDVELARRLKAGWTVERDEGEPVELKCRPFIPPGDQGLDGCFFKFSSDSERVFYDLWLPPAFVPIAREIMAERKASLG